MNDIKITINSDRDFQKELGKDLKKKYPDVGLRIILQKAWEAPQITEVILNGAQLAIGIVLLVLELRKRRTDSKFSIEIEYEGKKIEIDAENQEVDINKIVEDFLSKD